MKHFTSHLKKDLIRITLLLFSVVAFLCPLDAYAQSDIGSFLYSKEITNLSVYSGNLIKKTNSFYQANGSAYAPSFSTNSPFDYSEGDIFTFSYYVLDFASYDYLNGSNTPPSCLGSGYWLTILNCDMQMGFVSEIDNQNSTLSISGSELGSYNSSTGTININNSRYYVDSFNIQYKPQHFYYFSYIVKANHSRTGATSLDFQNNIVNLNHATDNLSFIMPSRNFQAFSGSANIDDLIQYLEDHPDSAGQQMEQNKQDTQNAQQDAQSAGNTSSSDATSTGQTLLGALTSFIGAITNASPGNCTLTLNTGYGFNLGNVNLCSISPPASFQVISSLVVIGFAVPLSISASKKMIELFRGFTG